MSSEYMVAVGLPVTDPAHALVALEVVRKLLRLVGLLTWGHTRALRLKCGMHSGPVYAGVPCKAAPRYRMFGDTVNMTARIKSKAAWGEAWLSKTTQVTACAARGRPQGDPPPRSRPASLRASTPPWGAAQAGTGTSAESVALPGPRGAAQSL